MVTESVTRVAFLPRWPEGGGLETSDSSSLRMRASKKMSFMCVCECASILFGFNSLQNNDICCEHTSVLPGG